MKTILLISPYWKENHRWMVSSVKLAELWQGMGYRVVVVCMGDGLSSVGGRSSLVTSHSSFDQRPPFVRRGGLRRGGPATSDQRRITVQKVSETLEVHCIKDIFLPDPWNYGIAFGFTGYVRKIIKEEKPDIIIANKILFWTSLSVIWLRLTGHKVIVLTDALVGMTWWPRNRIPKICAAIYAWTLGWLILLCAKRVVFFNPQPAGLIKRLGIAKKAEVIPTGIDVASFQVFKFSSLEGNADNLKTCKPANLQTITYVGRLESVKGVDDLLAVAVPLKKDFLGLNIQVVGWYKDSHPLVEKFQHEVNFTGLSDDVPAILAKSDIFVLPSYSEGLSNALMEAMACGCACIATEVGGNRFLIQNGVSGFLYPPGDREALKAHLRRLIEDSAKRKSLGEAARKRIEKEFDWKAVGEKYGRLFEKWKVESGKY